MHERLHKALQGTNQTWHLKRRAEQSSPFIWYFRLEKEPFILHLIFKFLNCHLFVWRARFTPNHHFWKVSQSYFLFSGAPMLRAEGREGLLCAMFTFDCRCWERLGELCFWSLHLQDLSVLLGKRMENWIGSWQVWWMRRSNETMVRVKQLELLDTCLVAREWSS